MTTKKKPDKPYADFPLFPASNGQWAKKINGKRYYFGVWSDPDSAVKFYERVRHDLYSGREPSISDLSARLTLKTLSNLFLAAKKKAASSGEISEQTYKEYHRSALQLVLILGQDLDVTMLRVDDFVKLRQKLSEQSTSPVTLKNHITRIKVLFRWAYDTAVIDKPAPYRSAFKLPSATLLRKARNGQSKLWEPKEIRQLLKHARGYMKPAIYLAINCGLGNKDFCELKWLAIKNGWLTYPRPKTGVERKAKLWPETVAALDAWKVQSQAYESEHVCCTEWSDKLGISNTPIAHEFEDLAELAKVIRNGRGFYALRHTYRTVADGCKDQPAIMLTMGHADSSISGVYRQHIEDARLKAVSDHVRAWLKSRGSSLP